MKRTRVLLSVGLALVLWSLGSYLGLMHFKRDWEPSPGSSSDRSASWQDKSTLLRRLKEAERELQQQKVLTQQLEQRLKQYLEESEDVKVVGKEEFESDQVDKDYDQIDNDNNKENEELNDFDDETMSKEEIIPILMFACNRPTVSKAIDSFLAIREDETKFPLFVSQDCEDSKTRSVIESYGDALHLLDRPDFSHSPLNLTKKQKNFEGYYKISRHYKYALSQIFDVLNYSQVIIVEDDLELAPDFLLLFQATLPILRADPTLFCVSAWNDNGKAGLIDTARPELLYRTDFFGGLGWMMLRSLWKDELASKWPPAFWDDWLRDPLQRRQRSCIRPEISRSKTFGKVGVSHGMFYEKHLKFIQLSEAKVDFRELQLDYLMKDNYDRLMEEDIRMSPVVTLSALRAGEFDKNASSVRLIYRSKSSFKSLARALGIMDDFKSGVPRMAYKGVVPTMFRGTRVLVAPSNNWKGYDPKW